MNIKYTCKIKNHEKEPIVGFCFNTDCTEITSLLCPQCQYQKHMSHKSDCYSFHQIKQFIQNQTNKLDGLLLKSIEDIKSELDMEPEIKKLLIMTQKMESENQKFQGLKEYIQKKLFSQGIFEKFLLILKSLDNQHIILNANQLNIQEAKNSYTDSTNQCEIYYNSGKKYYEEGCFSQALECFELLLHMDPKNLSAQLYKGCSLNNLHEYQEAIKCFDGVLEIDQNHFIALNNKGYCLILSQACHYIYQNILKKLKFYLQKALKLNPDEQFSLINKGNVLFSQGREEEAMIYFEKAQQMESITFPFTNFSSQLENDIRGNNNLESMTLGFNRNTLLNQEQIKKGLLLLEQKLYKEALQCFDKEAALNPQNSESYWLKGYCLLKQKQYQEALQYLNLAIQMDPISTEAYNLKGNILLQMNRIDEAQQCFDTALRINLHNKYYFRDKRIGLVSVFQNFWACIHQITYQSYADFSKDGKTLKQNHSISPIIKQNQMSQKITF